jgi:hypothetical protein
LGAKVRLRPSIRIIANALLEQAQEDARLILDWYRAFFKGGRFGFKREDGFAPLSRAGTMELWPRS